LKAKEFFSQRGITITDYDVGEDRARANEMIEKSKQMGTPVIFVDDKMMIGFDQKKMEKLLEE